MEFVRGMFLIDFIIKLDNYKLETTQFRERKILSPEENVIELGKVNYRSLSFSHFVVYRLYHYPAIVIAFLTLLLALLNINGPSIRALNPVQETVFTPREKNFARVLDAWNNKYHGEALPSSSNELILSRFFFHSNF